jgi:hypothetical protein
MECFKSWRKLEYKRFSSSPVLSRIPQSGRQICTKPAQIDAFYRTEATTYIRLWIARKLAVDSVFSNEEISGIRRSDFSDELSATTSSLGFGAT